MTHGLYLNRHRHPQLLRMSGEQALRITGIIFIALLLLALLLAVLGYLIQPN